MKSVVPAAQGQGLLQAILLHSLHPWRLQGLLEILFQTISTEYLLYSSRQPYCISSIHGGRLYPKSKTMYLIL